MRTAVVIPTLNAEKCGKWNQVLQAVADQNLPVERHVIIDSTSDDATRAAAESYGWECRIIRQDEFNHGLTRTMAVRELAENGFDTVVFLSQDVILNTPDALSELVRFLWNNPVAGCYGRQISLNMRHLNAWQRAQCYPAGSAVKTLHDIPEYGIMTPFFSNAFSAWKTAEVIRYGGFPETSFGEDMLFAANVLNHGGAVGYCSTAVAVHEHSDTPGGLFLRGKQVGAFHRKHPELLKQFGKKVRRVSALPPLSLWFPLGMKLAGYVCGRFRK